MFAVRIKVPNQSVITRFVVSTHFYSHFKALEPRPYLTKYMCAHTIYYF